MGGHKFLSFCLYIQDKSKSLKVQFAGDYHRDILNTFVDLRLKLRIVEALLLLWQKDRSISPDIDRHDILLENYGITINLKI